MLLSAVPSYLERTAGARVGPSTVRRWATRGVAGVRLPVRYIGGRPYVDAIDLDRFFMAIAAAKGRQTDTD